MIIWHFLKNITNILRIGIVFALKLLYVRLMYYHYHSCVVVVAADIADIAAAVVVVAGYCPRRVYFLSHYFS